MMRLLIAVAVPVLLGACTVFPEFNPPEESMAKAPRTSRQSERFAPGAKTSQVAYESGIWIARQKPERQEAETPQADIVQSGYAPAKGKQAEAEARQKVYRWAVIPTDRTLKQVVSRWATEAGWQLVWDLRADYEMEAQTSVTGTFEQAMEVVAGHMANAEVPMKVIFYKQNKVVRIVAKGAE